MGYVTDRAFYLWNRLLIRHANLVFRGVLKTPPIATDPSSDIILFSILDERAIRPYLLSAKSFLRYCPPMNVVIQSDGSITNRSQVEIRRHLPHASFLSRESTEEFVRRHASKDQLRLMAETNWWVELKLLGPLLRFPGKYVILFDSDLLFLKRPQTVLECLARSPWRTFHSPGGNALAEPLRALGFDFSKVDIRSFNAGFIGFHNAFPPNALADVSAVIRKSNPRLFEVYDIEQALWSILLNSAPDPVNLKSVDEHYVGNGWSPYGRLRDRCVLAHFVGATRFRRLMYVRLARRVIRELQEAERRR